MHRDGAKFWMIANITHVMTNIITEAPAGDEILPEGNRPEYIHYEEKSAEDEIVRLQTKYPNQHFVLLEATHYMQPKPGGNFSLEETC